MFVQGIGCTEVYVLSRVRTSASMWIESTLILSALRARDYQTGSNVDSTDPHPEVDSTGLEWNVCGRGYRHTLFTARSLALLARLALWRLAEARKRR